MSTLLPLLRLLGIGSDVPVGIPWYRWVYFAMATTMGFSSVLQFLILNLFDLGLSAANRDLLLWGGPWSLSKVVASTSFWFWFGLVQIGVHGVVLLRARLSASVGHQTIVALGTFAPGACPCPFNFAPPVDAPGGIDN